jgi:hypothetical protein
MTAPTWDANLELVRRDADGERVGYLREVSEGHVEPLRLLGMPLGESGSRGDAIQLLREQGLASISQRWWVRAPLPLVELILDARLVDDSADWRMMVVAELTPDRALLRSYYPSPEEAGKYVSVALPAEDVLRADYPDDE